MGWFKELLQNGQCDDVLSWYSHQMLICRSIAGLWNEMFSGQTNINLSHMVFFLEAVCNATRIAESLCNNMESRLATVEDVFYPNQEEHLRTAKLLKAVSVSLLPSANLADAHLRYIGLAVPRDRKC